MIKPIERAHVLIYTLFYPAVLGSLLFALIGSLVNESNIKVFDLFFSSFLLIYFVSQHVQNSFNVKGYNLAKFILDLIEIILILVLYLFQGFFTNSNSQFDHMVSTPIVLYYLFAITTLFPVIVRKIYSDNDDSKVGELTLLSLLVFSAATIMSVSISCDLHEIRNLSLGFMYFVLFYYLIFHLMDNPQ